MATEHKKHYYGLLMAAFITVLLCSNLIGPAKVCEINLPMILPIVGSTLIFGAGNLFFPISYVFGDILTEVYGYAATRKVIWAGFLALIFASLMTQAILLMPPSDTEPFNQQLQPALEIVFGSTWRIVFASFVAFWVGDFINAYLMAKMKLWTEGRHLWTRTIGSTIGGQAADSLIFYPIAFYGVWDTNVLWGVLAFNFFFKVTVEALMTPFTYWLVNFLKQREKIDHFDRNTDFTPFSISD